jgi:hypothetical protein
MREKLYTQRLDSIRENLNKIELKELDIKPEDLIDKFCNPDAPVKIHFNDISAAAYRIKGGIEVTPCTVSFNFIKYRKTPFSGLWQKFFFEPLN